MAGQRTEVSEIAGLLRSLRAEVRLTQQELADAAGVSVRAVSDLERGVNRTARRATASHMADALGLAGQARATFLAAARGRPTWEAARSAVAHAPPVPAQLPPDPVGFVGRGLELAHFARLAGRCGTGSAVPACVIDGPAGIGKTALAVRVGHRMARRFDGGQLFVDLHGFDPLRPPMAPEEALAGFLCALGISAARVPAGVAALAGMYRGQVAGRRVLVILDNAASADQVRPLLPGTAACLVLITSRSRLAGLVARDGARLFTLDVLSRDDARALMIDIVGARRVTAEREHCDTLIELCGYLPLALRIAAAWAVAHPASPLAELAARLADNGTRLDALAVADDEMATMRSVLWPSCRSLAADEARAFRLLSSHAGDDVTLPAAAELLGASHADTKRMLEALTGVHLLRETVPGRYRFHELVRLYGAERAKVEEHGQLTLPRQVGRQTSPVSGA